MKDENRFNRSISASVFPAVVKGNRLWRQFGWIFSQVFSSVSGPSGSIFPKAHARGGKSGSCPLLEYTRPSNGAQMGQVVPISEIWYRSLPGSWVRTAITWACAVTVRRTIAP